MVSSKYSTKHAFLSEATCPHTINLILNLIYKDIIKKTDLLLIIYGTALSNKNIKNTCQAHDIQVLEWDEISSTPQRFLTLSCLSLQPITAKIIINCLNAKFINAEKVNILITDDEIDRWLSLYNREGKITINTSALINDDVLNVLKTVDNYIVPYTTWGKPLEKILGRRLNIIDAVIPFDVLDYGSQDCLEAFLNSRKRDKNLSTYKVLLFTKPQNTRKVFNIIASYLSGRIEIPSNLDITIGTWLPLNPKGMMLYMSLKALIKLKNLPILLKLEQPVSSEQYALMLHEYDCLILQERGGFSTAKYFAENVGKLITLKDSFNDKTLNVDYGIETFNSKSYIEAIKDTISAAQKNEVDSISTFASQLTKKHEESFDTLRHYWNSF